MQTGKRLQTTITVTESGVWINGTDGHGEKGGINPAILVISPDPHVVVTINDGQAVGKVAVTAQDTIHVHVQETEPRREAIVEVLDDGMEAVLSVSYQRGVHRQLELVEATPCAELSVKETEVPCDLFTVTDIATVLTERGITGHIEWADVQTLIGSGESGSCTCALGQPVIEVIPEHYDMIVVDSEEVQLLGIVPIHPVTTVRTGTPIAKRVPAVPGKPGRTVLGQVVEPKPVLRPMPSLGSGVCEDESGIVVATRSGRVVSHENRVDVAETLQLDGSVRLGDGHIWFDGDVVIKGDVQEGVEITAGGRVVVSGTVSHATITADQGITIGGAVIASSLNAGTRAQLVHELTSVLVVVSREFSEFIQMVEQMLTVLAQRGATVTPGRIANHIIEERFERPPAWADQLRAWADSHHDAMGSVTTDPLYAISSGLSVQRIAITRDIAVWHGLLQQIYLVLDTLPKGTQENANIQIKNAQNSALKASGNIVATGQGFYRCTMKSGDTIRTKGTGGVILGCQAVSGTSVEAREIGSFSEVGTTIEVLSQDGKIMADVIHPGTLLQYDSWKHRVVKEMNNAIWP